MTVHFPLDVSECSFIIPSSLLRGDSMVDSSSSPSYSPPDLHGKVALVAGATRGVGRGIALALGEAGATVYCTGRSTRKNARLRARKPSAESRKKALPADYYAGRPETIEETAEWVTARGGEGIAVAVDHLHAAQVEKLVAKIRKEQKRLDV